VLTTRARFFLGLVDRPDTACMGSVLTEESEPNQPATKQQRECAFFFAHWPELFIALILKPDNLQQLFGNNIKPMPIQLDFITSILSTPVVVTNAPT
jgi:hypothetical protein